MAIIVIISCPHHSLAGRVYIPSQSKKSLKMKHYLGIFVVLIFLIQFIFSSLFCLPTVINHFRLD